MTDSQRKVLTWLEHQRKGSTCWYRPSQIQPDGYPGGPSAIGKVLRSLLALGLVEVREADRGNGTTVAEYRAAPPKKQLEGSNVGGGVSRQCDVSVIVGEPENTIRDLEADIAHWRAEVERLREALQKILELTGNRQYFYARHIAAAALEKKS